MALFSSKKNTKKSAVVVAEKKAAGTTTFDVTPILRGPRITEKASRAAEKNVYVFNVSRDAGKKAIAFAVEAQYKVAPLKVRVASIKTKKVFARGKAGVRGGGKKAYVYLKAGETIQIA